MANVSVICFLASYLVAFALELTQLLRRVNISRLVTMVIAAAGLLAHTVYLFQRSSQTNLPPLLSSSHDWLLVLAWLAIVFYLFLMLFDRNLPVGVFLLPLVLVLIGSAYFVSQVPNEMVAQDPKAVREAIHRWAMLHASLLMFGIGGVLLGFVLSMMYLVQHYRLKHKQPQQKGLKLPNLERLAWLNWLAVVISVPLLTFGMAAGVVSVFLSQKGPAPVTWGDPWVIVNGFVWLVMVAFFVWLVTTRRPAGKQVAWLTIWAFGFLLVTLLGLQVLTGSAASLETWHARLARPASIPTVAVSDAAHDPLDWREAPPFAGRVRRVTHFETSGQFGI